MKIIIGMALAAIFGTPGIASAALCVIDGVQYECVGTNDVVGTIQVGTLPKFAGITADIYITGGNSVDFGSNFTIYANDQQLCYTGSEYYSTTPIRHCKGTINAPGTYTIKAVASIPGQNFVVPNAVIINVD